MICQWIALDRAILRHLQEDGRLEQRRAGRAVQPLAVARACAASGRSSEPGAIRGYHADIDPATVDRGFEVVVHVELDAQGPRDGRGVRGDASRGFDEVVECRRMFGVPDYVIRVAVADPAAYETFYMTKLAELPGSPA